MTYMPVDGKPDRMHVGARALDLTKWIEINSDYEIDLAQKQDLLTKKHDEVFVSIPLGDAGSREVLELLSEHLPRIFPERWPNEVSVDPNLHPLGSGITTCARRSMCNEPSWKRLDFVSS
jgi:hypothetical protein